MDLFRIFILITLIIAQIVLFVLFGMMNEF
jgi:hypothetical protein